MGDASEGTLSRFVFLVLFTAWGFVFPRLLCLHGYCYQERDIRTWVNSHGWRFTLFLVTARLCMIATLPVFLANLWGFLR